MWHKRKESYLRDDIHHDTACKQIEFLLLGGMDHQHFSMGTTSDGVSMYATIAMHMISAARCWLRLC